MQNTRIKLSTVLENLLPGYIKESFPLVEEFFKEYYNSLEGRGLTLDVLQNIDQYLKLDNISNLEEEILLQQDLQVFDNSIVVSNGFRLPNTYGIIQIDDEIILYKSKLYNPEFKTHLLKDCYRGFSAITGFREDTKDDYLDFSSTKIESHTLGAKVKNLSNLILFEFFRKIKIQFAPGFENESFYKDLNENLFIKQIRDFYTSKGTEQSFKILFKALYGEKVEIIKPQDFLFISSNAEYRISKNLVVEQISGDITKIEGRTIRQEKTEISDIASAIVNRVQSIERNGKRFYTLSVDFDYDKDIGVRGTTFGSFVVGPKTVVSATKTTEDTSICVDSTVGFPKLTRETESVFSPEILIKVDENISFTATYSDLNNNQFLSVSEIPIDIEPGVEIFYNNFCKSSYFDDDNNEVEVLFRVTGVLSDLEIDKNFNSSENTSIQFKTLGKSEKNNIAANNWIFNLPILYDVKSIRLINNSSGTYTYNVELYDNNILKTGDLITLLSSTPEKYEIINPIKVENDYEFTFSINLNLNLNLKYQIRRKIKRFRYFLDSLESNNSDVYTSDIQNVYYGKNSDEIYVTTNSFPNYRNDPVNPKSSLVNLRSNSKIIEVDNSINASIQDKVLDFGSDNPHPFLTGDEIFYSVLPDSFGAGLNLEKQTPYYVKKINDTKIKIAVSRSNIFTENYFDLKIISDSNGNELFDSGHVISKFFSRNNPILSYNPIIRKIQKPIKDRSEYETKSGQIGIFINGAELSNYKSTDKLYYNKIQSIIPVSPGINYDVKNAPLLNIIGSNGTGCEAYPIIKGELVDFRVLENAFNYLETPTIQISGGNGSGANARVTLESYEYSANFNASEDSGLINLYTGTIGFSTNHNFYDGEEVYYDVRIGSSGIGGLQEGSKYYVGVLSPQSLRLYENRADSLSKVNQVVFNQFGFGTNFLRSTELKKRINSVEILSAGINYSNKKVLVDPVGINTFSNKITCPDLHRFSNNEKVVYKSSGSSISGLSTSISYFVKVVDDYSFSLSTSLNSRPVNLNSIGVGTHSFQYEPISVRIVGKTQNNKDAKIDPIFRGGIESVYLYKGGSGYGSNEIINYKNLPEHKLVNGSSAQLTPIIVNGQIVKVVINNPGKDYYSIPDIQILGDGNFAKLIPIVQNNKIVDVLILSSGSGYSPNSTSLIVKPAGSGANLSISIQEWTINEVERYLSSLVKVQSGNLVDNSDSFISKDIENLKYSHLYAPRKLREILITKKDEEDSISYSKDLVRLNNQEVDSNIHSPIIGWAYDGNPIYGPYGYEFNNGTGRIRKMISGYKKVELPGRPNFPDRFFVEDFEYVGNETAPDIIENSNIVLDKHNGRFCVTPEYPDGVYAYFCTIEESTSTTFLNYRKPQFPYVIGNSYYSKPIEFNFDFNSNQNAIEINSKKWIRNTYPYNLQNSFSKYEFLDSNLKKGNLSRIISTKTGSIDDVKIISSGSNYNVNDQIIFEPKSDVTGKKATARVSEVEGRDILNIKLDVNNTTSNLEFYFLPNSSSSIGAGNILGITSIPNKLINQTDVLISGIKDYLNDEKDYFINKRISIKSIQLVLSSDLDPVSSTGLQTYINVVGNLDFPNIKEDDIFTIGSEKIKVLRVDRSQSRLWILRNYDGSGGQDDFYPNGTILVEDSSKFEFQGSLVQNKDYRIPRNIYFNPNESLGLGLTASPNQQFGRNIVFSNPGVGRTQIFVSSQRIYLPNHGLSNGTKLIYSSEGSNPLSISTDGISINQLLDKTLVYTTVFSQDFIGISTVPVGISTSSGNYENPSSGVGLLYFADAGSGNINRFKTNADAKNKGNISNNIISVTLKEKHNLNKNDAVRLEILSGIGVTFKAYYNTANRRIVFDKKLIISSNVSVENNLIKIYNHGFYNGQKVIYKSPNLGDLINDKIYYVFVSDLDNIGLLENYSDSPSFVPNLVGITSAFDGELYSINPKIKVERNQTVNFDLSDSSLSSVGNNQRYPAFKLNFYKDSKFSDLLENTQGFKEYGILRSGFVGITSTARVSFKVNDLWPNTIYYKFDLDNISNISNQNKEIVIDTEVIGFNQLSISQNKYNGLYNVVGVGETNFNVSSKQISKAFEYDESNYSFKYYLKSISDSGKISKIEILDGGSGYKSLPGITSIKSNNTESGFESILFSLSESIGEVKKIDIQNIGSDFYCDYSLRPTAKLPELLKLEPFSSFDKIDIISPGINYLVPPTLLVFDGVTGLLSREVILNYLLTDTEVNIAKNSNGLFNKTPRIIPINNTNGIGIRNISYNSNTNEVTIFLNVGFSLDSNPFPFEIGDKVLIENVNVGRSTIDNNGETGFEQTGEGYNSRDYGYKLFTLTDIDENYGGTGSITFNIKDFLPSGKVPGIFNDNLSPSAIVVPEKYFPILDIKLKKNTFIVGETVETPSAKGIVEKWDPITEILTVSTVDNFKNGEVVRGRSTFALAKVSKVDSFNATYVVGPSAVVNEKWQTESGFLNNSFQKTPDNDYYQYFSYSLKSKKSYSEWEDSVSRLNHISGFKKFADLNVESEIENINRNKIVRNLSAGRYYIRAFLYPYKKSQVEYIIQFSATGQEPNQNAPTEVIEGNNSNTFEEANDIGYLSGENLFVSGKLQSSDRGEYYIFELLSPGKVEILLLDESESIDIELYNFNRQLIEGSRFSIIPDSPLLSELSLVSDFIEYVDLNCYNYFDLVSENSFTSADITISDEVIFENVEIQDYIESVGNRVLLIDDISPQFDNSPRKTRYSVVDTFNTLPTNYKKYFAYVKDKRFDSDRQFSIISLLYNKNSGFINEYGTVDSFYKIGSFDFSISEEIGNLEFYPEKFEVNDFDISLVSFNLLNDSIGISTQNIGNISSIVSNTKQVSAGIGSTTVSIAGIASTDRTSKILISLKSEDETLIEFNELTVLLDNNYNATILDYGHLSNNTLTSILDKGIYDVYYDNPSQKIVVDLTANVSTSSTIKVTTTSISLSSTGTGSSEFLLDNSSILSSFCGIGSTAVPGITTISSYSSSYASSYHIVSVSDIVGNRHQTSEINILNDGSETYIVEYGVLKNQDTLCSFGSTIIGSTISLYAIPIANASLEVRVFTISQSLKNPLIDRNSIDIGNTTIEPLDGEYLGTESEIKRVFDLFYDDNPIFERVFNGSTTGVINLLENKFDFTSQYFNSGEEISYDFTFGSPIGIATTTIPGIGVTDKLPKKLFAVKINERSIQVAATVEDSLKFDPNVLTLTSVGIGTIHKLTSTYQNNKSLICLDNIVQSPIVSTSSTTTLSTEVKLKDVTIEVNDSSDFVATDLIKIDNEILKIRAVGVGSTNVLFVSRNELGSNISTHSSNSVVAKISGNYNIIGNKIYFIDPPYGKIPESDPDGLSDDFDWTGITSSSSFHGRVFLRNSAIGSTEETYSKNYIFDNISDQFTGIKEDFILKINGQNATGLSTSNVVVLIKDIFQIPQKTEIFDPRGNYRVVGTAQTTTLLFDKLGTETNPIDVNVTNIPVGGVIQSVSSKGGFGYQPLVAAGATPVVSSSGTIQSLVIGNSGSGYRKSPKYEISSKVSQLVSVGSSNIFVEDKNSLFKKLSYSSNNTISIGTSIKNISIVGFGTNYIQIGTASTLNVAISSSTSVVVSLNNPNSSLIDIGIVTSRSLLQPTHIGFTTSVGGYISSNINITNPGSSYTNFPIKYSTTTSSIVSIGSTIIPITSLSGVIVGNYIGIGTYLPLVEIVGIASTSVLVSSSSTLPYQIPSSSSAEIKEFTPPSIVFEDPLPYSNIPLKYSLNSPNGIGIGTNAYIDIQIGQDRILEFDISNSGSGYKKGDILTLSLNGDNLLGISTDPLQPFDEFQIIVDQIYNDKFSAWSVGDIDILDPFDELFDGTRDRFPLKLNGDVVSIRSRRGSTIDIKATLLIVINDVIQIPDESYTFSGGSVVKFKQPPRFGDKSYILFYKGTSEVDTAFVDILESIKVGDDIVITSDDPDLKQGKRTISNIISSDRALTNLYTGVGINSSVSRPVIWCKQTEDRVVNGIKISKNRDSYEPLINPSTKIIKTIGAASSEVFVESVRNLFNSDSENTTSVYTDKIKIISENVLVAASATCNVSSSGTITSFNINNIGMGYETAPSVTIQSPPVGIGTTLKATAFATISSGKVTSITVTNPGFGYTYGPISKVELVSNGLGFPSGITTSKQNNIYYRARLKSSNGFGKNATINIGIDQNNVNYFEIIDKGNGYSVGDQIFIDQFDNKNLKQSDRNTLLSRNIVFRVTSIDPPLVLISPPTTKTEIIKKVTYEGDYGEVVGMGTTGLYFYMDFLIPFNSPLRDGDLNNNPIAISGIQTGYYFTIRNSNLGNGSISLTNTGETIGIGTTCFDNIYQVYDQFALERNVPGVGVTYVTRVKTRVQDLSTVQFPNLEFFDTNNITFDSTLYTYDNKGLDSRVYGQYSWGRISIPERKNPIQFIGHTINGIVGLSTNPSIERFNPLRYKNYT